MRLHLVRHPPAFVAPGTCYGRSEVACAAADPDALASLRTQLGSARVISSPSRRCADLARRFASEVQLDPRLLEIDFGEWEQRAFDTIDRAAIDTWAADPWGFVPPGGESAAQMAARVLDALHEIRASDAPEIVVVAHGGPLRVMLGTLLQRPRREWLALDFDPGDVVSLEIDHGPALVLARMSLRSSRA